MLNAGGVEPLQTELQRSLMEATPINRTGILSNQHHQSNCNPSKRSKGGDDSFEREHRLAPNINKYFYNNNNHPTASATMIAGASPAKRNESVRQLSFPPFKINFDSDDTPSELAVIKDINKHCKISLSYGRYSTRNNKKSFLLYANSNEQFERLLNKSSWPSIICSRK